ncbi:MAG: DUF975 family protein [Verrucomicrobiota bacterium]
MSWYYELDQKQEGPISKDELESIIRSGKLPPQSRVWTQGMADWEDHEKIFAEALGNCPACGQPATPDILIPAGDTTLCTKCRDTYAQRLREGVSTNLMPGSRGTGGLLSASELRANARQALIGNWGIGAVASLIYGLISIAISFLPIVGVIVQYLIAGPMSVGMSRLFINIERDESPELGDMFKGFTLFLPSVGAYFVLGIISLLAVIAAALPGGIFLGIVLFPILQAGGSPENNPLVITAFIATIIPVILASSYVTLRYGLVYFIIADQQKDLGVFDSFKESSNLMKGRMLKLLWLALTFTGWFILGALTLGIGFLWISPYFMTSVAAFYDDIHESA